ncbi:MAG TPA: glucose-1-phosphate adenylyltransferase [Casimicrobiaceae bacterium]|nr:glucose-1-phosphate adenylyltransferase [Casimicrobiaceae bacterium]
MPEPAPVLASYRHAIGERFVSQLTKRTFAVVLAGGRGSRLHELTDWRAKPAVPFGGKFRIIDFTLSNCLNSGIRRIGVATQYKAQSLIRHLQRGWGFLEGRFDEYIEIMPAQQQIEESWYQGTADAVYQNLRSLRINGPQFILILSGDHVYKMDYGKLLASHVAKLADCTVACIEVPKHEASAFGVIGIDEDERILSFTEKPKDPPTIPGRPDEALASMGIYVFNADFLYEQLIRDAGTPGSSHDFGKDVLPYIVSRYRTYAHSFAQSCVGSPDCIPYWRDVGTLDAYWEANMELTKVVPELNMYDADWPIWTYQEQLPPAKFVFDEPERRGMAVDSLVSGGCVISGATVRRSLLFTNVRVDSGSTVEDSAVLPNTKIGRNVILQRAIIDKQCVLHDGMRIGVDHEADRKRYNVTSSGVTLVTPDMLGQNDHRIR